MNLTEHINVFLLHHILSETADRTPDKTAVVARDAEITYAQLSGSSRALAGILSDRSVSPGDLVGLYLPKSIESIIALFGVLMCGGVYVPIDPNAPKARVRAIIEYCGIRTLVTSSSLLSKSFPPGEVSKNLECIVLTDPPSENMNKETGGSVIYLEQAIGKETAAPDIWSGSDVSPAYILHTSGSTGSPKGVVISHLNALTFVRSALASFDLNGSDRFACHAPLHFDLTVFDVFVAVSLGATLVLVPDNLSVFPLKLAEYIRKERITVWNSVSSVLSLIADKGCHGNERFDDMRLVIFSGEVLPVKYLRKLREYMGNTVFCNIYGQTEANSSTCYRVDIVPEDDSWIIPVGKPLPNFEVFLMDEDGREVIDAGREGEVFVKGATVALGYFRNPGLTREKFPEDPRITEPAPRVYRTGDMAMYDKYGDMIFTGRRDDMVKVRGHRVELGEIERCLSAHEDVQLAVAVAVPDEKFTNRIFSFVCPNDGVALEPDALVSSCSRSLPPYMVPEKIWVVEGFPLTPNDKIDRRNLTEIAMNRITQ